MHEMLFNYTGWIRGQKIVPAAALKAGTNHISVINAAETGNAALRATQLQLKYLWDKSDYILQPGR